MCILEEIGFTKEQYIELRSKGIRDHEIATKKLGVPLETFLTWKTNLEDKEKSKKPKKTRKPTYYFTLDEWKQKKADGMKEKEIAKEFGFRNLEKYYEYRETLGIPKRTWYIERTPELIAQIKKYAEQGFTQKAIAQKLDMDITDCSVGAIMREYGIVKKKNKRLSLRIERTPELIREIKGYLDKGMTTRQIAKASSVKMSQNTVCKIIKEEGLRNKNIEEGQSA